MLLIIVLIVSFIPYSALFLWLRTRHGDDPAYRKLCGKALGFGVLSLLPVILLSGTSYFAVRFTGVQDSNPLLYQAIYTFIILALMEEIVKYLAFRWVLKKTDYPYSWMDTAALMTIVGTGFGVLEAVIYAIGSNVMEILLRGICLAHAGCGFIIGYFYGKGAKLGKPIYKYIGFLTAWLLHGLYDFSLSPELFAINDNLAIIPLSLALLDIILVIMLIVFVNKAKKREIYTEALK